MWQKVTNIYCANTAKSFKCYLYCRSFDTPPLISDELWWNKMTHIHNLTMNSFSTDFAYLKFASPCIIIRFK